MGEARRLDPRTKLVALACMAASVALAPNMACELLLMALAASFGAALGKGYGNGLEEEEGHDVQMIPEEEPHGLPPM
ncbi:hypothetical protein [Olsenella phocaeensis]|uniref:hypothetical protein n=1 Tax=Olsenella phocaeensis TaxID=1852385 RepID=UPI00093181A2|nr:hypothetical protein [Olsenella phocaeensis]